MKESFFSVNAGNINYNHACSYDIKVLRYHGYVIVGLVFNDKFCITCQCAYKRYSKIVCLLLKGSLSNLADAYLINRRKGANSSRKQIKCQCSYSPFFS